MRNTTSGKPEFITRNGRVYITIKEAAAVLAVTDRTIRTMIADGRLVGYRIGKVIRLRFDEVEAAMQPIPAAQFGEP
jgi:excisionase family DNA binding protein